MREQDIQLAELRLRLCCWGPEEGHPLLVLHGFLEQGAAWAGVAEHLQPLRVVAPDHRGHGRSEHVAPGRFYHFWDYISDVDQLVDHLGGRVDLLGHSMGGSIATLFAASRPDAVRRLVLVEGTGPPDDRSMALHRARKHLVDRRNVPVHRSMPDLAHAASRLLRWNSRLNDQSASRLAARCTEPHPDGGLRWSWDPRHRWRNPRPIDGGAFQQYLSGVTAPTLVVVGAESAFRMPDDDARRSALRTPTLLELPGAGHMVHHDQPATLARAIRAHLA